MAEHPERDSNADSEKIKIDDTTVLRMQQALIEMKVISEQLTRAARNSAALLEQYQKGLPPEITAKVLPQNASASFVDWDIDVPQVVDVPRPMEAGHPTARTPVPKVEVPGVESPTELEEAIELLRERDLLDDEATGTASEVPKDIAQGARQVLTSQDIGGIEPNKPLEMGAITAEVSAQTGKLYFIPTQAERAAAVEAANITRGIVEEASAPPSNPPGVVIMPVAEATAAPPAPQAEQVQPASVVSAPQESPEAIEALKALGAIDEPREQAASAAPVAEAMASAAAQPQEAAVPAPSPAPAPATASASAPAVPAIAATPSQTVAQPAAQERLAVPEQESRQFAPGETASIETAQDFSALEETAKMRVGAWPYFMGYIIVGCLLSIFTSWTVYHIPRADSTAGSPVYGFLVGAAIFMVALGILMVPVLWARQRSQHKEQKGLFARILLRSSICVAIFVFLWVEALVLSDLFRLGILSL